MKIKQLQTSCCSTQLIGPYYTLCMHCISGFTNVITVCKDEQVSRRIFTACNVSGAEFTNDLCNDFF